MREVEVLQAKQRECFGKGNSRALRRAGEIPCSVYGGNQSPLGVSLEQGLVSKRCCRGDFFSRVLELDLHGQKVMVLPKEVQYHPVTDQPLHVDFLRVSPTSEIRVQVPIEFLNQENSPAIKLGAILNIVQRHIEILCSPLSIPDRFEIDLSGAKMGTTFTVEDLKLPEGCRLNKVPSKTVLANIVQSGSKDTAEGTETAEATAS